MRHIILTVAFAALTASLVGVAAQARPQEPYPGQHDHLEPPKGFFCSPAAKDKAHECHCKRMSHPTVQDPGCCETPVVPDWTCTVWCWEQHCLCPIKCEVPTR